MERIRLAFKFFSTISIRLLPFREPRLQCSIVLSGGDLVLQIPVRLLLKSSVELRQSFPC